MRRTFLPALLLAACLLSGTAHAQATTDVADVKFPNTVQVAGQNLLLNGAGVRYKLLFKVYAAGLYLPTKVATTEAVLAERGPRQMRVVMLRDVDGNELGKLFTKGIEANVARAELSKSISGIVQMGEIFSRRSTLKQGDSFAIEWVPGTGTVVLVNGKPEGVPVPEPEFFSAMMAIWLGKSPADAKLKDALLGKAPVERSSYN